VAPRTVTECGGDGNEAGAVVFSFNARFIHQELFHDERQIILAAVVATLIAGFFPLAIRPTRPRAGFRSGSAHDACACRCAGGRARRGLSPPSVPVIATAAPAPVAAAPAGPANPATIPQAQR